MDLHTFIAKLAKNETNLKIPTYDLCCLAALHLKKKETTFREEEIIHLFEDISETVTPNIENKGIQISSTLSRFQRQQLLFRVDVTNSLSEGEYVLTQLAIGIVSFFEDSEKLTQESLVLLTKTLQSKLSEIKGNAARIVRDEKWISNVINPLQVIVSDLVSGIARRQRGLEKKQTEIKTQIENLLHEKWADAIDASIELLDGMRKTLNEVYTILQIEAPQLINTLQDIEDLADEFIEKSAEKNEVKVALFEIQKTIKRIKELEKWAEIRSAIWSAYYQRIHRYIQDIIRIDPKRAFSTRLTKQLIHWKNDSFSLRVLESSSLKVFREITQKTKKTPVVRKKQEEVVLEETTLDEELFNDLESLVLSALKENMERGLAELTEIVLQKVPKETRFRAAGRVAALVVKHCNVTSKREPSWVTISPDKNDRLEIEQWEITKRDNT